MVEPTVAASSLLQRPTLLAQTEDVSHAVRRLRWFSQSFKSQIQARADVRYTVDERRLSDSFVEWLQSFLAQKHHAAGHEEAFTGFAAGLMLRALIRHEPLRVEAIPAGADRRDPAYFWPEGFAYVAYCLNVRGAVLEQELGVAGELHPSLGDIRVWWSFRENVREDASLAIPYLDLFAGAVPNWIAPDLFTARVGRPRLPRPSRAALLGGVARQPD